MTKTHHFPLVRKIWKLAHPRPNRSSVLEANQENRSARDAHQGARCRAVSRSLREENRKLKGLVADLSLDKHVLQEVLSRKV